MKTILIFCIIGMALVSCQRGGDEISLISSSWKTAESVFLTQDQNKRPVLVWTERGDTDLSLIYATSSDNGKSFGERITLSLDQQVATHAEGMPKVAFKENGTVIVAYEKKSPTKENKYAGVICYRASADKGKSWSTEQYLHSDTVSGRSRSYFDIETLPDGEVGASWLDIKLNVTTGGRSVRFAKTNTTNIFTHEVLIDSSACQCCRTEVNTDDNGKVNIAYRGLKKGIMDKTIRDMMIASSLNNGATFSVPFRISNDNWSIDGCPHTGPVLCSNKGTVQALWYTEGSGTGIFYAHRESAADEFSSKELISGTGHHPQATYSDNGMAIVWEENTPVGNGIVTRIRYQIHDSKSNKAEFLTPETFNSFAPVISKTTNGFVVAFLMNANGNDAVYVKRI